MAGNKTVFFCKECGYESAKWMGKCPSCNSWNSFVEETVKKEAKNANNAKNFLAEKGEVKKLKDIQVKDEVRVNTGFEELDRVFGRWYCSRLNNTCWRRAWYTENLL